MEWVQGERLVELGSLAVRTRDDGRTDLGTAYVGVGGRRCLNEMESPWRSLSIC